jgi:hypothetical protein
MAASGLHGSRRVAKDGSIGASWFETREDALLTMRSGIVVAGDADVTLP